MPDPVQPGKVLLVRKSNLQVGGVEMQMLRIALWLRSHEISDCILATDDLQGPLAQLFRKYGFEVETCTLAGKFYLLKVIPQLLAIVSRHNVKIVQAHLFRESVVCRLTKLFRPKLTHLFRVETYIDCSQIVNYKKKLYHLLARITDPLVNNYIANGNLVGEELKRRSHVNMKKAVVVYNGVEPFGEPDMHPIKQDEDGFLRVAMVANFISGKGHEFLIEAVAELMSNGKKVKVFFIGADMDPADEDGRTYSDRLKELIDKLNIKDNFVFCGFSANLKSDLIPFGIVILPSYFEGTPNTILEAMSVRKLVITSDAGELPFLIQHGISGFIHPKGDRKAFCSVFEQVLKLDDLSLNKIRDNGYHRWKTLFSLESMMDTISKYYHENINIDQ